MDPGTLDLHSINREGVEIIKKAVCRRKSVDDNFTALGVGNLFKTGKFAATVQRYFKILADTRYIMAEGSTNNIVYRISMNLPEDV